MSFNHEHHQLQEECFHDVCAKSRWLRYCTREAVDQDGDLGEVIDQLNYSLYGTPTFERGGFSYRGEIGHQQFTRVYEQEYLPSDLTSVIGYRLLTTISHSRLKQPSREVYQIAAEWYMADEDEVSESYRTEYCIEKFESGAVMATITELDLVADTASLPADEMPSSRFVDRPMTGYDHQQLGRLLTDINSLQVAEHAGS